MQVFVVICGLSNMKVLGIDPGTTAVGYAVVAADKSPHLPEYPAGKWGDKGRLRLIAADRLAISKKAKSVERLGAIFTLLGALVRRHRPQVAAVEKVFFNRNVKTAIQVAEARGVILLTAHRAGLRVWEYTPLEVKLAVTGYGRAGKSQVGSMVRRLVKINGKKLTDDVSDAIAIAITALHYKKD